MTRVFISYGLFSLSLFLFPFSIFFFTNVSFVIAPSCCSHLWRRYLVPKSHWAWMRMGIIRERGKDIWHSIIMSHSCVTVDGFGQLYSCPEL